MNQSYKIGLLTVAVLSAVVIGYYLSRDGGDPTPVAAADQREEPAPAIAPRRVGPVEPQAASGGDVPSLMDRVRKHTGDAEIPTPEEAVEAHQLFAEGTEPASSSPASAAGGVEAPAAPADAAVPTLSLGEPPASLFGARPDYAAEPAPLARAARTSAAVAAALPATYTIRAGDTFSSIARQHLGSEKRWGEVAQANPLVDPIRLKVGQTIRLPENRAQPAPQDHPDLPTVTGGVTHTVKSGESLRSLARQYYSDQGAWRIIYQANRKAIGANPDHLRAGQRLVIPPAALPAK